MNNSHSEAPTAADRRSHPRVSCEILTSKREVIRNASLGGLYLESRYSYKPGQEISLEIPMPSPRGQLTLPVVVVRNEKKAEAKRSGYGLIFRDLSQEQRNFLSQYLLSQGVSAANSLKAVHGKRHRLPRFSHDFLQGLTTSILGETPTGTFKGELKDVSKYGVAFYTPKDLSVQIGKAIKITVKVQNDTVFEGNAAIRHITPTSDGFVYGLSLRGAPLNVDEIFAIKDYLKAESDLGALANQVGGIEEISPLFKSAVSDLRFVFHSLRNLLAEQENKINRIIDTSKKKQLIEDLLETADSKFRKPVYDLLYKLEDIDKRLPVEQKELHRHYYRTQLLEFIHDARYAKRAFEKPLGYAGDFETLRLIYQEITAGVTLWERVVSSLLCTVPTTQAVRNRARYLYTQIKKVVLKKSSRDCNIMTLAAGSCQEIQDFLDDPTLAQSKVSFCIIDQDPHSLIYSQNVLGDLNLARRNPVNLFFYNDSSKNLLKADDNNLPYPQQDLIYVAGLFDYLPDEACRDLTGSLFRYLKEGGRLIVGNMSPINPVRCLQEYGLDWYLIYRTEKELKNLIPDSVCPKKVFVETEETKINFFLNIIK